MGVASESIKVKLPIADYAFSLIFLKRWSWAKSGRFFRPPRLEFKELSACFFFFTIKDPTCLGVTNHKKAATSFEA